jgi:UDP-N-acetylmuramoyl-L-alanyl-D-glutamate--2,6-diaminopimelate ligase
MTMSAVSDQQTRRTLADLLTGIAPVSVLAECGGRVVTGIYDDSRRVRTGGVFVAISGTKADGRKFIGDAVARGAIAVVGEEVPPVPGVVTVSVPDARVALTRLALRWHGLAADGTGGLKLAGVTGTNGKSTTAFMLQAIMHAAGQRCGLLGTVHYDLCERKVPASMTTPGPLELAGYLRECATAGAVAVVLEVSSHALDQRRTEGLRFAAAAFTNLTGDHLDYHKTFDAYRAAKARLFTGLDPAAVAVVNRDDPNHEQMIRNCRARIVTYAIDQDADLRATISASTSRGTTYRMHLGDQEVLVESGLLGKHNVYNALAAAGLAQVLGADVEAIAAGLRGLQAVPGRLQRVPCDSPAEVFVDYAHSDDSLRNVLSVLRPLARGRLILVFGCGGDRDRLKRPRMARVAAQFADLIFVTNDNPRTEDPQAIIEEILRGFDADAQRRVVVEPDRARAIWEALAAAEKGDIVLIAGKGHETYQVIGNVRVHFDDVATAIHAAAEIHRFWPGEK